MPREIIDTQRSQPGYLRRRRITLAIVGGLVLFAIYLIWTFVAPHHPALPARPPGT